MRTRHSFNYRGSLLGAAVAGVLSSVAVSAQAQDNLETVVVLGTYSSDTTALTSTAPIDVLKGEELQKSGATTLNQALWQLVPSFNFPQNQPTTRGQNPKGASLRGLSTDQTLVLINGKRRHASSIVQISSGLGLGAQPVDLDAIPFSAIERIEVLRDGASAQYGSDAIAGVINIVLKSSTDTEFNVQVGQFS
ncbi:MAG TPA: TonB-dependent receptor plug domain-containing protein, partial [Steroidobacter sp.]|nr:TonB-dependent receptor plug domain-containing protein [Steroidobacter sp.]